jgi:pimeloyl-ACP methyl ester carboxylesterase
VKGELVRAWTEDDLQLQGLYCTPRESSGLPAVLHIHGASSNFYRSQFLDPLAERLNDSGLAFLTGNTRGHDIINSVYTKDPRATRRMGVCFEIFEDCVLDIGCWISFLETQGHRGVVLIGHSFGAHKVAFYQSEKADERVKALVFMSPADHGFWLDPEKPQTRSILSWASDEVSKGSGESLLHKGIAPYPMSASTIHNFFVSNNADIFRFGRPDEPWEIVSRFSCPILAMMGTVAEFIGPSPGQALSILKDKASGSPRCDIEVVEGAPHNYRGYETQVTDLIVDWVTDVLNL